MRYTARQKLKILNRAIKGGKTVSEVCKKAGIARKTFYQWKERYQRAPNRIKKQALRLNYASDKTHPRNKRYKFREKVISVVVSRPSWGSRKISAFLSKHKKKISNHAIYSLLKDLNLEIKAKREEFSNLYQTFAKVKKIYQPKPLRLTPESRKRMVEEVVIGEEAVADVCRKYHLSRKTFYKWLGRYQEAQEKEAILLQAMEDNYVKGFVHPRSISEELQEKILEIVRRYPEYSTHKVAQILAEVGNHGIQDVFRRLNLNTYEKRLVYAQAQAPVVTPVAGLPETIRRLIGKIPAISAIPPPSRERIASLTRPLLLSLFSSVVSSTIFIYWLRTLVQLPTFSAKIGLVFASGALVIGSIFFAYSMKYYLTLALVLSFSRQSLEEGGGFAVRLNGKLNGGDGGNGGNGRNGGNGGWSGWLRRIFGLVNGNGPGPDLGTASMRGEQAHFRPEGDNGQRLAGGGLQPSLDHIKLKRYPFFSIHLPFYNEKKVAKRILSACTSMDYPAKGGQAQYEVIVCDDSTDETVEIAQRYAEDHNQKHPHGPKVKILHRSTREGFKGGALSHALKNMDPRTEFVCVFDADFIPYPDTLEQFAKYFKATGGWQENQGFRAGKVRSVPYDTFKKIEISSQEQKMLASQAEQLKTKSSVACVAGYQWHVLNKSENWITRGVRTEYAGSYVIERPGQEILGAFKIIHGSVYCIRADVLKHFGWGTSITEDFELTLRLYARGFKVVYTPYVQAPSECVATLKRLIRQRMRWAEGHSFNVKKMFGRLLVGRWEERSSKFKVQNSKLQLKSQNYQQSAINNQQSTIKHFIPSPLTLMEKLEFLYLSPYYLQAFFFMVGTLSWLISETVFPARLPFWTSLWGWSLVLTNFFALPLVNAVGMFLEESEEKDYLGLLSFVFLSYLLVPFQAYASVKGFIESQEGPWFRTPKTGKITDIFTRGRFYRWVSGILPGRVRLAPVVARSFHRPRSPFGHLGGGTSLNPYLALATANNRFNRFSILPRKKHRWFSKATLSLFLILMILVNYLALFVHSTPVEATDPIKIEQQIFIGSAVDSRSGVWSPDDNSGGLIQWDGSNYIGATVYFEVVLNSGGEGATAYAALFTEGGSQVDGSELTTTSTSLVRRRTASSISLTNGTKYTVRAKISDVSYSAYVRTARLIVLQSDALAITETETQIEVGDNAVVTATTPTQLGNPKFWKYDSGVYDGTVNIYFEATMRGQGGGGPSTRWIYCGLYDRDTSTYISASEVGWNAGSFSLVRTALNVSSSLTSGDTYDVRCYNSAAGKSNRVASAKVIISQSDATQITKLETFQQYRRDTLSFTNTDWASSTWYYNEWAATNWDYGTLTFYYEVTGRAGSGETAYFETYDKTNSGLITESDISTTNTSISRLRSSSFTTSALPSSAADLTDAFKTSPGANASAVWNSWLIVQVTNLQIPEKLIFFVPLIVFLPKIVSWVKEKRLAKIRVREIRLP